MSDEQEVVDDSSQSLPDSTTNDLDFEAFSNALSEAGYEEQMDPVLEELGIEHQGEMQPVASDESEGEEAQADEPEVDSDPFASLSAIERIDHQDAVQTLTAAGFTLEQLAEMQPHTTIQVANGLRARQSQGTEAQAVESALEEAPAPADFNFSKYADQAKEELGAKGAKLLEQITQDLTQLVSTQTSQAQRKAAEQAEGLRIINEQKNRLESSIPGLSDRPQLWRRITTTANALASTGLYGQDPVSLFDTAARTMGFETTKGKPQVTSKKILSSQPSQPKRQTPDKPRGPQTMDEYTMAMLGLMSAGASREDAMKKLGTPPG